MGLLLLFGVAGAPAADWGRWTGGKWVVGYATGAAAADWYAVGLKPETLHSVTQDGVEILRQNSGPGGVITFTAPFRSTYVLPVVAGDSTQFVVPACPQLRVVEVEVAPQPATCSDTIRARVRVENVGSGPSESSRVRLWVDGQVHGAPLSFPGLPVGGDVWTNWRDIAGLAPGSHALEARLE